MRPKVNIIKSKRRLDYIIIKWFYTFYKDSTKTNDYLFIRTHNKRMYGSYEYQRVKKIIGFIYIKVNKPFYLDDEFYKVKL